MHKMNNYLATIIALALAALIVLALVSALNGAPSPLPQRCKPVSKQITPGNYILTFGDSKWNVYLYGDSRYTAEKEGWIWYGTWNWNESERILKVSEAPDGWNPLVWEVKLDDQLEGKTEQGSGWRILMKRCK